MSLRYHTATCIEVRPKLDLLYYKQEKLFGLTLFTMYSFLPLVCIIKHRGVLLPALDSKQQQDRGKLFKDGKAKVLCRTAGVCSPEKSRHYEIASEAFFGICTSLQAEF